MATKLEQIRLDEISGVDEPANAVPGWLVMKNKDARTNQRIYKRAGDPIRLLDGRTVGRVLEYDADGRVTVEWINDGIRDLAKQGRLEDWGADGVYLVGDDGQIGFGKAMLSGKPVVLS